MSYIAFLDLLGTKDFSGEAKIYYENIRTFYNEIKEKSVFIKSKGKIGFFSDCAYIESDDIDSMINFLLSFRASLCSKHMFFNAAIIKGNLAIVNPTDEKTKGTLFGVAFQDSTIAEIYMTHNNFKGIGIYIREDVQEDMKAKQKELLVKSIFLPDINSQVVCYKDLKFDDIYSETYKSKDDVILSIILQECLLAYTKSSKAGRYYISVLATLINSYKKPELKWSIKKHSFDESPSIYNTIFEMAKNENYSYILGLDSLCFCIVNKAFSCEDISYSDRIDIANEIMNYKILKKYTTSIQSIPDIFDDDNREQFIRLYQEKLVKSRVNKLIKN